MITIIAAVAKNGVIGSNGKIPWKIPEEMDYFRETTLGHIIIMGRKTWDSLHVRPLPDRLNIVISKSSHKFEGAVSAPDLETAIKYAKNWTNNDIFIIGGANVYHQALEGGLVDKLLISKISLTYEGDTYFPEVDKKVWFGKIIKESVSFNVWEYRLYGKKGVCDK
jgi:dihydrofolate reductase